MRIPLALLLGCLSMAAQTTKRYPAGADADGKPLTVIERHFPDRPASDERCVPKEQYLLGSEPLVTVCQTENLNVETDIKVGPNSIRIDRDGAGPAAFFLHRTYQISPWRASSMEACEYLGMQASTYERWNFRNLGGQAWLAPAGLIEEEGLCSHGPKAFTYLLAPIIAYDAASLEKSHTALGSCALRLDASGKNGLITWGTADAKDPVEVKLLWTGKRTLVAQVADPARNTTPAASWINADHFEIWMGASACLACDGGLNAGGNTMWQFGIPIGEGPVQAGFGNPGKLPTVRRWTAPVEGGRTATVLLIELPPWPGEYADGVTIVYSQSLEGRAQKRLIATSRVKRGDHVTLGRRGSTVDKNSAGEYVTCGPVKGALDITGTPHKPVEVQYP